MADVHVLDSGKHRDLRVVTKRGAEYGEATHIVPVVADELRNLALEYPVVLVKGNESGQFTMCAVLGFEHGENLFLDGEVWDATYIPINVRRQPFSLSFTAEKDGEPDPASLVIAVDMASSRIQEEDGERLFNDDGSNSDFLMGINDMLAGLGPAATMTDVFIDALASHDLIEHAQLDVQFSQNDKKSFDGLYSVNDEKLRNIEGDVLADLYKRGFLQGAWMMLASVGNLRKLLFRRAERDQAS